MVVSNISLYLLCYLLASPLFTSSDQDQPGSYLTSTEEATALASNSQTVSLIQGASKNFALSLNEYNKGTLTWEELQTAHSSIFSGLIDSVKSAISSSAGPLHAISYDYDESHQTEYEKHLEELLGLSRALLKISAENTFLPPLPSKDLEYPNLIIEGETPSIDHFALTSGSGNLVNGQIITTSPNGATFSQKVATKPGSWYIISGYITGADEGADKYGNPVPFSGSISVVGGVKNFVQVSNELDHGGKQRRYFWIQASSDEMTISISGAGAKDSDKGPIFQNISVRDLQIDCSLEKGQAAAFSLASTICPPANVTLSPEAGWYPQIESELANGDNLIDGKVSIMKNIDQSAMENAGHPYWYFYKGNSANAGIKIVNALNGAHGLFLPPGADPVTNGVVAITASDYTLSFKTNIKPGDKGSLQVTFSGTNLNSGETIAKVSKAFENLIPGEQTLSMQIPSTSFTNPNAMYRPSITFQNNGTDSLTLYNVQMVSEDTTVYEKINAINPYVENRSWYNTAGCDLTYDFTTEEISTDWAIALTGNTMFAADPTSTLLSENGIVLKSNCQSAQVYSGGGIQSTQFIDPMRDFTLAVTFSSLGNTLGYEPTFAVWSYGESQRGPDAPLSHRNAPSADVITEFDCEMGSDPNDGQPAPSSSDIYMRPGSYIGYAVGGHNEILPEGANWILMPNFWEKNSSGGYDSYTLTMSGSWVNGQLLLSRKITNNSTKKTTALLTQNLGAGPFSPMYIKIAMENPSWNSKSHIPGSASIAVKKITLSQGADIPTNILRKIPLSLMDYCWFTPGGGGGMSYTPFIK